MLFGILGWQFSFTPNLAAVLNNSIRNGGTHEDPAHQQATQRDGEEQALHSEGTQASRATGTDAMRQKQSTPSWGSDALPRQIAGT